jgi:hypothetical protein
MEYIVDKHGLPTFGYFGDIAARNQLTHGGIHEASHALLDNHFGHPVGDARVWLVGEHVAGFVSLKEHPRDIDPERLPGWLIACVAGQVGEAHWMSLYRDVPFEKAMVDTEVHAGGDLEMFHKFGGRRPPITLEQARARARVLLVARWPLVERHAGTLVNHGRMDASRVK